MMTGLNNRFSLGNYYTDNSNPGFIMVVPTPKDWEDYEKRQKRSKFKKRLISALRRFIHGSR